MTDQILGFPRKRAGLTWLRPLGRLELRPGTAWVVAALIAALLARQFWVDEGSLANVLFTAAVTLAVAAFVTILTRRVLFATVLTASLVAVISLAASIKQAAMSMVVHAYDLFFYLGSWSTVSYLWSDHRRYVLSVLGALAVAGIAASISYRVDGTRVPRRWSALALLVFAGLAWYGAHAKGERRHMQFHFENHVVSSFYASWGETLETLWRGAIVEAAPQAAAAGPGFLIPTACKPAARPPHIILIHQESVVQPSLFPTLGYDRTVDALFRSDDERIHQLRVETYGGASWLTEFSLLAGVSSRFFGGMRQFVQTFTQNRLKDTLPQALERCGYRNVVFYPMLRNFVSNDKFYASIDLKEIFDATAQGARGAQERDRFYYGNAIAEMGRHFKSSHKPLFVYIQTMMAHWPYDFAYMPEVAVQGGGPGTDPEMHEYLRRISMAGMDFDFLMQELRERFPREQFLVVHYGDHHPMATRTLLGFGTDTEAEDVALSPGSIGFITYYAARGINYDVPALPPVDTLDVPYLGTVILDLARLPLSDSHAERKRLMSLCAGRYYGCSHREEILKFHRRLMDSGLLAAG
jgi:hypothetical protein